MTYEIIATGSDGNATILNGSILIDCGVPMKALLPHASELKLVLLTHGHGDHFHAPTVKSLARMRPSLRWACCPWMIPKLAAAGVNLGMIDVFEPGQSAWYKGVGTVRPQETQHNVSNCCWHIETDDGEKALYATDCGSLDGVEAKGYDLYLVEANHKRADLEARVAEKQADGEFAYEIRAAENHLSWEQTIDWLTENAAFQKSIWIPMHGHKERDGGETNADAVQQRNESDD